MKFEKVKSFSILSALSVILAASLLLNSNFMTASAQTDENVNQTQSTEPAIGDMIVWQGTISSIPDPLKGHESHEVAILLPPRGDKAVYAGLLTFIASKPVEAVTLHYYDTEGFEISDELLEEYGWVMNAPAPWSEGDNVATAMMALPYEKNTPTYTNNVPFVGNALAIHTTDGEPFMATYTVKAKVLEAEIKNNIDSLISAEENTESEE